MKRFWIIIIITCTTNHHHHQHTSQSCLTARGTNRQCLCSKCAKPHLSSTHDAYFTELIMSKISKIMLFYIIFSVSYNINLITILWKSWCSPNLKEYHKQLLIKMIKVRLWDFEIVYFFETNFQMRLRHSSIVLFDSKYSYLKQTYALPKSNYSGFMCYSWY